MVGGYVILTKKPLVLGENNIGEMYGSTRNARKRFTDITAIQKPVIVEYNTSDGGDIIKLAELFVVQNVTSTTITLSSVFTTLTFNRTTGIATLTKKEE